MESIRCNYNYRGRRDWWFLLASDLHIFNDDFDYRRFKKDFERAKDMDARIYINGDVMELIVHGDPRYVNGRKVHRSDNEIYEEIMQAADILAPYADFIDVIGSGNHETAVQKHYHIDPIVILIDKLNSIRSKEAREQFGLIKHGGYEGNIWQRFYINGKKKDAVQSFDIFYNHGQGGRAEVTKGMIDLNRRATMWVCDLIWLGHKHTRIMDLDVDYIMRDNRGVLKRRRRRAVITGCYLKGFGVTNSSTNLGYKLSYGKEKMRAMQARGGLFMHQIMGNGRGTPLETEFLVS